MLRDLFGVVAVALAVVVVVVVVDVFGFLHECRYGAGRVFDDVRLEFVQFRERLELRLKKKN